MSAGKNKIYAYCILGKDGDIVKSGTIYTWDECQGMVKGKRARYKSFRSEKEANEWLKSGAEYESREKKEEKLLKMSAELERDAIYFDAGTGRGNGVEVRLTDFSGKSLLYRIMNSSKLNEFGNYYLSGGRTNNFGELTGLFAAIRYALKYNIHTICGDSALVIDYWSKGRYNRENLEEDTLDLIRKVTDMRKEFENRNGIIKKISGDVNPADIGFHK